MQLLHQLALLLFLVAQRLVLPLLQLEKVCLRCPSSVRNHPRTFCRHARFPGPLNRPRARLVPSTRGPTRATPKELQTLELFWRLV